MKDEQMDALAGAVDRSLQLVGDSLVAFRKRFDEFQRAVEEAIEEEREALDEVEGAPDDTWNERYERLTTAEDNHATLVAAESELCSMEVVLEDMGSLVKDYRSLDVVVE